MKLTEKKTVLGIATAIVVFIGGFFIALDKGFDFWEEHIKARPAPLPENFERGERTKITQHLASKDSLTTARGY